MKRRPKAISQVQPTGDIIYLAIAVKASSTFIPVFALDSINGIPASYKT